MCLNSNKLETKKGKLPQTLGVNIYFHNVAEILDILTHFKQECPAEQKREQ